jgi:putative ABC transport system permease protein
MLNDLRYALRVLVKSPGFTLAVVLTLGLGIAATTSVFSVVDAVLLQPFRYRDPEQLVRLVNQGREMAGRRTQTISYPDLRDAVDGSSAFSVATYSVQWTPALSGYGEAEILNGGAVDSHFFETFGVQPERGRFFLASEDKPGNDDKVVISHGLWMRKFGGADIIGKALRIDGRVLTVVGIVPPTFEDPRLNNPRDSDIWTTLAPVPEEWSRSSRSMSAVARLRQGVTLGQARARVKAIAARLRTAYPADNGDEDIEVIPVREMVVGDVKKPLALLLAAAGLLLLIACANVVNLMLARTSRRAGEIAVRVALGASPWHLLRRLLAEALVLSAVGGGLGVLLANGAVQLLHQLGGGSVPRLLHVTLDRGVLLFAFGVTLVTAVVTAILPAVHAIRGRIAGPSASRGASAGLAAQRAQATLVVVQVAISVVVIATAALLGRSLWNLFRIDKGFNARGVLTMQVRAPREDYKDRAAFEGFYRDAASRLAALPGVERAGVTTILPYDGDWSCDGFTVGAETPAGHRQEGCAETRVVDANYLPAIGATLVRGRMLDAHDDAHAPLVVVVDQGFAKRAFGNADPIGKQIRSHGQTRTIVGLTAPARLLNVDEPANPVVFIPNLQDDRAGRERWVVLRTSVDPAALMASARGVISGLSPNAPVMYMRSMREVIAESLAPQRFRALLVGGFALAALLLAAIGVAGMLAFATSQRLREIGIRLALGATRGGIARLVVARALQLVILGSLLGIVGALAAGRFVEALLFGVRAADPLTLGAVVVTLTLAALLAAAAPALRAASVEPVEVLRSE